MKQLLDVLVDAGVVASRSEGRRAIAMGGVKVDGVVARDFSFPVMPDAEVIFGKLKKVQ